MWRPFLVVYRPFVLLFALIIVGHWLLMVCLIHIRFLFAATLTPVFILDLFFLWVAKINVGNEHCAYALVIFLRKYQQ